MNHEETKSAKTRKEMQEHKMAKVEEVWKVLNPGRRVELATAIGPVAVTVYPIRMKAINAYAEVLGGLLGAAAPILQRAAGEGIGALAQAVVGVLAAAGDETLVELLGACCKVEGPKTWGDGGEQGELVIGLGDLPFYQVLEVLDVWIEENLDEPKKVMPLAKLLDQLIKVAGLGEGQPITALASAYFSEQGTVAPTS